MHTNFNRDAGYYSSSKVLYDRHLTAWTAERYAAKEEITGPALTIAGSSSETNNNYWLQNKAYARIKNLELGYSLNSKLLSHVNIDKMRLYLSVTNLYTFDHYKNNLHDVENKTVVSFGTPRYYNVGLNLTF